MSADLVAFLLVNPWFLGHSISRLRRFTGQMALNIMEEFMSRYRDFKALIMRTETFVRRVVHLSSTFRQDSRV